MARKPKNVPDKINPNLLKTRDPFMLAIILGATKAGVAKDQKKEKERKRCRRRVKKEEEKDE